MKRYSRALRRQRSSRSWILCVFVVAGTLLTPATTTRAEVHRHRYVGVSRQTVASASWFLSDADSTFGRYVSVIARQTDELHTGYETSASSVTTVELYVGSHCTLEGRRSAPVAVCGRGSPRFLELDRTAFMWNPVTGSASLDLGKRGKIDWSATDDARVTTDAEESSIVLTWPATARGGLRVLQLTSDDLLRARIRSGLTATTG